MKNKPRVSVIIPVYNSEDYLEQALESLVNQEYKDFEVIIINDGSTDNSLNIIYEFASIDSRFKVFSLNNSGQGYARYVGINKALGKYIAFMDSDDYVKNTWLGTMVSDIELYDVDIASVNYFEHYEEGNRNIESYKFSSGKVIGRQNLLSEWCMDKKLKGFLWNKLFRSEVLKRTNIQLEFSFMEDSYLLINTILNIQSIYFDNRCEYFYRFLSKSSVNSRYDSRDRSSITAFLGIEDIVVKCYPSLKKLFEVRMSKIELFLIMKMDCFQIVENRDLIERFGVSINKNKDSLRPVYNSVDSWIVTRIRTPKSAFFYINLRKLLIRLQRIVRSIKN